MKIYKIFRIINVFLLISLFGLIILYNKTLISTYFFTTSMTIIASLVTFSGLFATKPIDAEDVSGAVDRVLFEYDTKTYQKLKDAKEEEQKITDFIENKSNEIFLLKIRSYLEEEIKIKYKNSELSSLIEELANIEKKLDSIDVHYKEVELPSRFKKVVDDLNQKEKVEEIIEIYSDLIDSLPLFPLKKLFKVYLRMIIFEHKLEEEKSRV